MFAMSVTPGMHDTPDKPVTPVTPVTPGMHDTPDKPVTPVTPDKPVTPVTPYRSVIPAKAGIQANVDPFTDPYPHLSIDWRNP